MDHVIELDDREWFKRCRRAWHLHSGARPNYEPIEPVRPFDVGAALHEALAAYYFPAMWQWSRALVRPIALETFGKAMGRQRASYLESHEPPAFPEEEWEVQAELGRRLLERYFEWAPSVDAFSAVRSSAEFDVIVPHPSRAGEGLLASDGGGVRFRGRVDLLVGDEHGRLWLVEHRLVEQDWTDLDVLALDDRSGAACWALESHHFTKIAGVIFNELRLHPAPAAPAAAQAPPRRRGAVVTEGGEGQFRRTRIRKTPTQIRHLRRQMAAEALEMADPRLPVYPSPSPEHCRACPFRSPCLAMNAGEDPGPVLESSYRRRVPVVIPLPPRTGSCGPQRVYGWKTKGPGVPQKQT